MSQLKSVLSDLLSVETCEKPTLSPGLYIVAVPIGNLEDFTLRALRILRDADFIACEDTRVTGKLLELSGLRGKKYIPCHDFNEENAAERIKTAILEDKSVALVTDAGVPLISDPGFRTVRTLRHNNLPVIPVPGASAPVTALSVSGLPSDRFYFIGFLPKKPGARQKILTEIRDQKTCFIFFERAERTPRLVTDLAEFFPTAAFFIAREMTKKFETFFSGNAAEMTDFLSSAPLKGEVTLLLHPGETKCDTEEETLEKASEKLRLRLQAGEKLKAASEAVALETGLPKKTLYKLGTDLKNAEI